MIHWLIKEMTCSSLVNLSWPKLLFWSKNVFAVRSRKYPNLRSWRWTLFALKNEWVWLKLTFCPFGLPVSLIQFQWLKDVYPCTVWRWKTRKKKAFKPWLESSGFRLTPDWWLWVIILLYYLVWSILMLEILENQPKFIKMSSILSSV